MPRGGARTRSGPPADPNSARSDRRGFKLTALPSEGYTEPAPEFPLPQPSRRELAVWESLWRTPQACAWSMQPWRWDSVAELAILRVRSEARNCSVGVYEKIRQWRDDLGLTPAGLKANGWAIAVDEVGAKAAEKAEEQAPPRRSSRSKLKVVPGGA